MTAPLVRARDDDWNGNRDEAVRLRCLGRSPSFIAAAMGVPKQTIDRWLKQEFDIRLGVRQSLIEQTGMELEWAKSKLAEQIQAKGDRRDVEVWLKVIDRKCKLFGLDSPLKVDVRVEDLSDQDLARELERNSIRTTLVALPEPVEEAEFEEKGVEEVADLHRGEQRKAEPQ